MTKRTATSENRILHHAETSVPVIILKANHHSSLCIARSLGRMGVDVYSIDSDPWASGHYSRYLRKNYRWDVETASSEATLHYLLEIAQKLGTRSILIPTYDEGVIFLAEHAKELAEDYIFPQLSPQLVQGLTSKKEMYFLAKKYAIPTAETYFPQSKNDLEKFLDHVDFPILLKGIYGNRLGLRTGRKMAVAATREELVSLYDQLEDPSNPNLMLQEYIPGGDESVWMLNGYFNENSECLLAITGRKIRQAPPYGGISSLAVCSRNDTIIETTIRLMKNIGYRGILDIGFRYDQRDGTYKVLDINPRIGSSFRLFVGDDGSDVARAEYLDLTGQEVQPTNMIEGRKWMVEDLDLISSIRYWRDKKITFRQWMKSYQGIQETVWFATDDPLPFFIMCANFSRNVIDRKLKSCPSL
jgi:D-aspartate ligase